MGRSASPTASGTRSIVRIDPGGRDARTPRPECWTPERILEGGLDRRSAGIGLKKRKCEEREGS